MAERSDERRADEKAGHTGAGTSRRAALRAAGGGVALLAVGGTAYAAVRLGRGATSPSAHGAPEASGSASAAAGSGPNSTAPPSGSAGTHVTLAPGFDSSALTGPYVYDRASGPDRTVVRTQSGTTVAVLTDGARTVSFTGPTRTFAEPSTTTATVTTDAWVRLTPKRWSEEAHGSSWFTSWFAAQVGSTVPDLFALYTQYASGAPDKYNADGVRYAGRAKFGELTVSGGYRNPLGDRDDRADFFDYLGVAFDFPDGTGKPNPQWYGDLDCSGLVRILYGYRMGYPMYLGDGPSGGSAGTLPRHSWSMSADGPGVRLFGQGASSAPSADAFALLQPGDLLFFAEGSDKSAVDHCGIYFGTDQYGRRRFLSSRMGANGPTFGDAEGMSVIDGTGIYSTDFRGARRI
jgi:cell wall-associated NlpC family hydrolase